MGEGPLQFLDKAIGRAQDDLPTERVPAHSRLLVRSAHLLEGSLLSLREMFVKLACWCECYVFLQCVATALPSQSSGVLFSLRGCVACLRVGVSDVLSLHKRVGLCCLRPQWWAAMRAASDQDMNCPARRGAKWFARASSSGSSPGVCTSSPSDAPLHGFGSLEFRRPLD